MGGAPAPRRQEEPVNVNALICHGARAAPRRQVAQSSRRRSALVQQLRQGAPRPRTWSAATPAAIFGGEPRRRRAPPAGCARPVAAERRGGGVGAVAVARASAPGRRGSRTSSDSIARCTTSSARFCVERACCQRHHLRARTRTAGDRDPTRSDVSPWRAVVEVLVADEAVQAARARGEGESPPPARHLVRRNTRPRRLEEEPGRARASAPLQSRA